MPNFKFRKDDFMYKITKIRPTAKMLIPTGILLLIFLYGCAGSKSPPDAEKELDIEGVYYGWETYTTPNSNTGGSPDTVSFPWTWSLTKTSTRTYSVHCKHPAVEGTGSIKSTPEYELSVDNIKLVNNRYIALPNYIQLDFEEIDQTMMAHGYFNMIKSSGETDVRVIVLTRISGNK